MAIVLLITGLLIIAAIIVLPVVAKAVLNNALGEKDGYTGRIERMNINPFTSTIIFYEVRIVAISNLQRDKLRVLIPTVSVVFKWKPLLKKILDLNIVINKPQVLFIAEEAAAHEPSGNTKEFLSLKPYIEKLVAFRMNVEVRAGEMHYINSYSNPKFDVSTTECNLNIHDFSNRVFLASTCRAFGTCSLYEGQASIDITLIPLEPTLAADLNLEFKSINLVFLNDIFRTYAKVDISKGSLNLFSEVVVIDNSFKGYLKPLITDMNFISAVDRGDTILQKIWESMVAGFYNLLENNRNGHIATKIPIEGRLDDPNIRIGVAILGVFRNAFVKAFTPSFDHIVNIK